MAMSTVFKESDIERDAEGRFSELSTSETTIGDLEGSYSDNPWEGMDPQEAIRIATSTCDWLASTRPQISSDELAGETLVRVLESIKKNGLMQGPGANLPAFIRANAHGLAVHGVVGSSRGQNISAFAEWMEACKKEEAENGHAPSAARKGEIADNIRLAQPPNRRATKDFHTRGDIPIELDRPITTDGQTVADTLPSHTDRYLSDQGYEEGSQGDRVSALAFGDDETSSNKYAARASAWSVIAEADNLPLVSANNCPKDERKRALLAMSEGGAASTAKAILDGSVSRSNYDSFRQPWSGASKEQIRQIAESMDDRKAYAGDLWQAAHSASNSHPGTAAASEVALPTPPRQFLKKASAVQARRAIKAAGGPRYAAQRFLDGDLDDLNTRVLLAPWGGSRMGSKQAREVATSLCESNSDSDANAAWTSSLNGAVKAS